MSRRAALCCIPLLFIAVDRTKKKKKSHGPIEVLQDRARLLAHNLTFEEMISSRAVRVVLWNFSSNMPEKYLAENKAINIARIKICFKVCSQKFKLFGYTLWLNNPTAVHRCFRTENINISFSEGCYGVKPDSVGDSWMCSRCAKGAWVVVSNSQVTYFFSRE